jgi:hypothetical protein
MALSSFPGIASVLLNHLISLQGEHTSVNVATFAMVHAREKKGESRLNRPFASDLYAISVTDRLRYDKLRRMVATAIIGQRELRDCIAVQIGTERPCAPY